MSAGNVKGKGATGLGAPPGAATFAVNDGAARKVYDASVRVNAARKKLDKLKALYGPDQPAYRQCEDIEDDLFEALRALGE